MISKYLLIFLLLTLLGYLYDKYKQKLERNDKIDHDDIVRKYLLNDKALTSSKPIIWIHIEHEVNSRDWLSFGSRNSTRVNQPYKYITIQSIINKAGGNFNVCLIDDESFSKLMPEWNIDLNNLADPVKSHMRNLALCNLLYKYGGMLVPSSYIALESLNGLYDTGLENNDLFVLEGLNHSITTTYFDTYPTHLFIGCSRNSKNMLELKNYLEILNSRDYTNEQSFLGEINNKCNQMIQENKIKILDGRYIGIKDIYNKPIQIEDLMSDSYIQFSENLQGILIPDKSILSRTKYQWFARMSPEQIYNSNLIISKYLLSSNMLF